MNKIRFTLNVTAALVILLVASSMANAQATRTWVSGVGDDANPCSRTAPCKTFAGAISKTAAAGEITVLDPGGFGAITITKSITINGGGIRGHILASLVNGVIVNLPNATDKVTLRGLDINGGGNGLNGIRFIQAGKLHVDNCTITGFGGNTGRGIDFAATVAGSQLTVTDTNIHDNGGAGISLVPTGVGTVKATINNVLSTNNANGISVEGNSSAIIQNTRVTHNTNNGFLANSAAGATTEVFIESSVSAYNGTNGVRTQGAGAPKARISNVAITGNNTGISIGTGEVKSFGNNHNTGNGTADGAPTAGLLGLQ